MNTLETKKIHVICEESYEENGDSSGVWIDIDDGVEEMESKIELMLENHDEWAYPRYCIDDYKGFGDYKVGFRQSIESVCEVAEFLSNENFKHTLLCKILDDLSLCDARELLDNYVGEFDSLADFATRILMKKWKEEEENLPDYVKHYFDYEAYGWDLLIYGEYKDYDGHFFRAL